MIYTSLNKHTHIQHTYIYPHTHAHAHTQHTQPTHTHTQIHTQVLHLAAEGDAYRREVFKTAAKTICRSILAAVTNSTDPTTTPYNEHLLLPTLHLDSLPPQLGLTRKYLQQAAVTMYVRMYICMYWFIWIYINSTHGTYMHAIMYQLSGRIPEAGSVYSSQRQRCQQHASLSVQTLR